MRGLALFALVLIALAAGASSSAATSQTSLRITYWDDSAQPSASVVWTLRCRPARGTLPRPRNACSRLVAGGPRLFAPTPENVACTQIYGGPQRARVVGTLGGRSVWATFARTDGCAIARWARLSPWLLPPGGVT